MFEARALAAELISILGEEPPDARRTRATQAFAHYVLGNASRQLIAQQPDCARQCAGDALRALRKASDLYTALAEEFDHGPWYGIANSCRGGILEAEVELGERTAAEALDAIREGLGAADPVLVGDRLESLGWWCIFACTIALRHTDGRDRQQQMSIFVSRGFEIADRLDNWSMRERLFTLEFLQRQRLNELAGIPVDWTITATDVRVLVGTMGRFPSFRSTGWRILESAKPIDPGRGN